MKSVIFDFNGTLFQDTPLHIRAWGEFFRRHGVPYTEDLFYKYMCGPPNSAILRRMLDPGLTDAEAEALSEEKEGYYRRIVLSDPALRVLTPGAEALLDALTARGAPFAIATGSTRANVDFYMENLGIGRWFDDDHIFCAEGRLPGKPDPAIYRLAMQRLGYDPRQTLVVEDAVDGIASAAGAGVSTIIAIDTTLGPDAFRNDPRIAAVIHDFHGFERFLGA